ncbi:MAG: hypothetical protein ACK55U_02240, partial [Bacteroidota bacterium]
MRYLPKSFLAIFLFQLAWFNVNGQGPATTLTEPGQTYQLDEHATILIDSVGYLTFEQILDPDQQKRFLPSGKKSLTFGYLN